jgi:hypothetical protein
MHMTNTRIIRRLRFLTDPEVLDGAPGALPGPVEFEIHFPALRSDFLR